MTMIITNSSHNNQESIAERIESIKKRMELKHSLEQEEISVLKYRLQQLSGGIAILRVGAATESELIERYDRVDDALNATRAAIQEGILPGGGISLARCSNIIYEKAKEVENLDVKAGMDIIARSVQYPFLQIIKNGSDKSEAILEKIMRLDPTSGYDAKNKKIGNMYDLGIVDPHKVVRCALENAVSAASMLLSVDCCLINVKQNDNEDI
jgi:chaperonin GroEL